MRIPSLLALLFLCAFRPACAADAGSLQEQINQIAKSHRGQVTLYAENLRTHETVSIHPDEPVQTASVIKLAILYEALRQIREGKVSFSDRIALTSKDQVPGSGVLLFLDTPTTITLKDALTMMIVMSDNTATNLVMDHLGIENIDRTIAALGLKNTYLYKKIFTPVPPGVTMPEEQKRFGLGKTTAHEMATLMTRLATCQFDPPAKAGDKTLCSAGQKMLHLQFYRNGIPRYLDTLPGATEESIANKTGSLEAVRNDVAAVSTRQGMIVISAFTYDNADHSWGAEQEGEITIAKMARAIVAAWSPEGLAPLPQ
jgi:beta-lactamase class A